MKPYGVQSEYEPTGQLGRCCVRACVYPALGFRIYDRWQGLERVWMLCGWHFIVGSVPFSMEYEDADALLSVPPPKCHPRPRIFAKRTQVWKSSQHVATEWNRLFATPMPMLMPTTRAAIEDSKAGTPIANHNSTGAFILWKGFGKKKIRKAQRNRPAGWHGNHPEQKPVKVSRETLDDIPIWTPPAKEPVEIEYVESEREETEEDARERAIAALQIEDFEQLFALGHAKVVGEHGSPPMTTAPATAQS